MKRYLTFLYDFYEPLGGMHAFLFDFNTKEDLKAGMYDLLKTSDSIHSTYNFQIYDTKIKSIIFDRELIYEDADDGQPITIEDATVILTDIMFPDLKTLHQSEDYDVSKIYNDYGNGQETFTILNEAANDILNHIKNTLSSFSSVMPGIHKFFVEDLYVYKAAFAHRPLTPKQHAELKHFILLTTIKHLKEDGLDVTIDIEKNHVLISITIHKPEGDA